VSEGAGELIAGRYRLQAEVGRGSFGRVWRARDERLDCDVAAKRLALPPYLTADGRHGQRAWSLREARSVARLHHPGIVTLHEVVEDQGVPWIIMELVDGPSLADLVVTAGALPPERVARIGLDVLDALRAAHAAGVVHRDVKPSNVLIAEDHAVLTDFGISVIDGDAPPAPNGVVVGAPSWIAPEQVPGAAALASADLWSLGRTLLYAAGGRRVEEPSVTDEFAVFDVLLAGEAAPRPPPGPLGVAIEALMRDDPARRPTAEEASRLLERALPEPPPSRPGATGRPDAAARTAAAPAGFTVAVPGQLPEATATIVGRSGELAALTRALDRDEPAGGPPAPRISAIVGPPGVGKTVLAVQWAHQVRDRFPDGQLYVDLRGYDGGAAMAPEQALDGFLRALGVPGQGIPGEVDAQAALYRSLLAGRLVLVVLDNAGSDEQVRPLLPGAPGCATVVTSRSRLSGLIARDGAQPIPLDLLAPEAATALLVEAVGGGRVEAEAGAAAELARLCGYLPLALRIAAGRVAARPRMRLADLVAELADEHARLDALAADDSGAMRTAFSWSYRALAPEAAHLFRLLGLHAGPDVSTAAVAALSGASPTRARRLLDALTAAHLLQETGWDRYRLHDLLRLYATERAARLPEGGRAAATERLLTWYLHSADAAARVFSPMRLRVPLDPPAGDMAGAPLTFADRGQALDWCGTERANLVAAVRHAAASGHHVIAWKLPAVLWDFFSLHGHWADWVATHEIGLASARRLGDRFGEAWIENNLGNAARGLGNLDEALRHHQRALEINLQIGHVPGEGWTRYNVGDVCRELGLFGEAIDQLGRALEISRQLGERWTEGYTLNMLGDAYRGAGELERALDHYRQALATNREIGHKRGEGFTLQSLGDISRQLGRTDEALAHYEEALAVRREVGDQRGQGLTLQRLGETYAELGLPDDALKHYERARAIRADIGDPQGLAQTRASIEALAPRGAERSPAPAPGPLTSPPPPP